MAPDEEASALDKFDLLLMSVMKAIQVTGDEKRFRWLIEQLMPEGQRDLGDVETFKVEYMRSLDRKKLVALVKEGQEEKKNEDV